MENFEMQNKMHRSQPMKQRAFASIREDTLKDLFTHEDILNIFSRRTVSFKDIRKNFSSIQPTTTEFIIGNDNNLDSPQPETFDDLIEQKLLEMKDGMEKKIKEVLKSLMIKYETYIDKVRDSLIMKTNIINNIFYNGNSQDFVPNLNQPLSCSYLRRYACKNIFEKLENILSIHEKIQSSIEQHFEILENFLDDEDLLFLPNPLQYFVKTNAEKILDSWFFSKINFEKMDLSSLIEKGKIPDNLKNFIFQDTKNKFPRLVIKKSNDYDLEKRLLMDNTQILENISFLGLNREDFFKAFAEFLQIEGMKLEKLTKMKIKGCSLEDLSLIPLFPNIQKIIMKATRMRFKVINKGNDFQKLRFLSLEQSNINTQHFISLIEEFASSDYILKNLEYLSVAGNNLTVIDLSPVVNNGKVFSQLKELNMENNRIYKFKVQNMVCLPYVRMINLIGNHFTTVNNFIDLKNSTKKREPSVLILMNKNLCVYNCKNNMAIYLDYLIANLANFDYLCKDLNLSFIFSIFNRTRILDMSLNSIIQISLKKLNLSYSSLDNATVISFLKNNTRLINLRKLELNANLLNDSFIDIYITENCFTLAENLEVINISDNKISGNNPLLFESLAKSHKMLRKIKLKNTPFEDSLVEYLKLKETEGYDHGSSPGPDNNETILSDLQLEYSDDKENDSRTRSTISEPIDIYYDFTLRLRDLKRDFKIVLNRSLKKRIFGVGRKSLTCKQKEFARMISFE